MRPASGNRNIGIGHNSGNRTVHSLQNVGVTVGEKFAGLYRPHRHKALFGGRGSGKSHAICEALVLQARREEKRIVGARQFQNSIRDSSKSLIEAKIKKLGFADDFYIGKTEIVCRPTDSRFTFIGLERNPDSARSLEGCDICFVEEARNISQTSMDILIPTIRKKGSEIWWAWNPVDANDPIEQMFRGQFPPDNSYIQRVGYEDNPYFFQTELPAEMQRMMRANFKKYQHIWLGQFDENLESRIFPNVRIGKLVIPETIRPQYGMDFGFANDPNALIKLYVWEEKKIVYIAEESFGMVSLPVLGDIMDEVSDARNHTIVADSSRPETIDFLNGEGFSLVSARKGAGSIKAGISWLQGYEIVIAPECVNMREEARLYSWQVDRYTNKILNVPCDDYNHGWDAVRYATEQNRSGEEPVTSRRIRM